MDREHGGPASIEIFDAAKTYRGGIGALLPTTLSIKAGEVLGILGPSGCGKTTLLRVVAGLIAPDPGGRILFNTEDVTSLSIERRSVGMVFQHYALFPQMNVETNIGYGLRVRGKDRQEIRRRVGEMIDLVQLHGLEKRRPMELSGGQRQRVALARAVAVAPRVLLLDEPLTALDAKLKESLRSELAALLRRLGITAAYVTHDQQEAMAIADRLAVMQRGRILQVGSPETLYRRPLHPFVATFLGRTNRLTRSDADLAQGTITVAGRQVPCPGELASARELLIRPEDLHIEAGDGATVLRRSFLGERIHFELSVHGAPLAMMCETDKHAAHEVGDRVAIRFDAAALMRASDS
jgi:putative spermidine/putrescine transport system ATP-binding protein